MTSLKHGSHLIVLITISFHVNILVIWAGWGFDILLVETMKVVGQTQCTYCQFKRSVVTLIE